MIFNFFTSVCAHEFLLFSFWWFSWGCLFSDIGIFLSSRHQGSCCHLVVEWRQRYRCAGHFRIRGCRLRIGRCHFLSAVNRCVLLIRFHLQPIRCVLWQRGLLRWRTPSRYRVVSTSSDDIACLDWQLLNDLIFHSHSPLMKKSWWSQILYANWAWIMRCLVVMW